MAISREDNELMCRVDNDAPMGITLRENFWVPALLSSTLVKNGAPTAVRLLGKDLVAFRSTDGRVGVFDERCPHRGASLLLAHNEDNALRCIFHGWKYDVSGRVVEVPTEPRNPEAFCKTVPLNHYPTREAAGVVFVWLGKGKPQRFPDFEFTNLPEDQCYVTKQAVRSNWVQNVEGGVDSAHVGIMHQSWLGTAGISTLTGSDNAPVLEFEDKSNGYRYAAIRQLNDGSKYIRVNEFVAPWYVFICPAELPDGDRLVQMSSPIDDYNTIHWMLRYNYSRPLKPSIQNPAEDPNNFPPQTVGGRENRWGQDRGMMMRGHFTGFSHLNTEDFATAESMGPIADRTKEFLNSSDMAIVRMRRILLKLARNTISSPDQLVDHDQIGYEAIRATGYVTKDSEIWKSQSVLPSNGPTTARLQSR